MNWPFVCLPVKSVWHIHPELSIPNYPSISKNPSISIPDLDHINPNHPSQNINSSPFKTIHSIPSQQSFHLHTYPSIQIHPSLSQTIKPQTIFPSPLSIPNNPSNSIPNHPSISIPNHLSISIPNHPSISYPNHPFISIPNHLSIPNQIIHPCPFQIKSSIPISPKPLIQIHL